MAIELVLDMSMADIAGKELEFKKRVVQDVAHALGGHSSKVSEYVSVGDPSCQRQGGEGGENEGWRCLHGLSSGTISVRCSVCVGWQRLCCLLLALWPRDAQVVLNACRLLVSCPQSSKKSGTGCPSLAVCASCWLRRLRLAAASINFLVQSNTSASNLTNFVARCT